MADNRELYRTLYAADGLREFMNGLREHVDRFDAVMRVVQPLRVESILDVGCNHGLFGFMLSGVRFATKRVEGVDFNSLALKTAKEFCGYADGHCLNAAEPFDLQRKFDLVLCMEILEHVRNPEMIVDNVHRHCGRFAIFTTPHEEGELDGQLHVARLFMPALRAVVEPKFEIVVEEFIESHFCESHKWKGWSLLLGVPR